MRDALLKQCKDLNIRTTKRKGSVCLDIEGINTTPFMRDLARLVQGQPPREEIAIERKVVRKFRNSVIDIFRKCEDGKPHRRSAGPNGRVN